MVDAGCDTQEYIYDNFVPIYNWHTVEKEIKPHLLVPLLGQKNDIMKAVMVVMWYCNTVNQFD